MSPSFPVVLHELISTDGISQNTHPEEMTSNPDLEVSSRRSFGGDDRHRWHALSQLPGDKLG